jgi:pimeloyl-ACP methyl ester carboxylesterase
MDQARPSLPDLVAERRMIPSDTDGIALQLIGRRRRDMESFTPERTLLLMHGATFPSESLFDVPVGGFSFMDALARAGYDVWGLDARGYGGSTRPPEMAAPPEANPPLIPARVALRDLRAAVDFLRQHRAVPQVNLLGMSWGATVAGAYAAAYGETVGKLMLVTPLWLSDGPRRIDPGGPLGAYRLANPDAFEAAWRVAAPEEKRDELIPPGWFDAWKQITLATDPDTPSPGTIRAPAGAVQDTREHWAANNPLYEPSAIRSPVLIVAAEWDIDTPLAMTHDLFTRLINAPRKRFVEIGEGTHMLLMEKNRGQAFDAVIGFLGES